jgi:NADPH:quinone reductase-like Zn-dependent oxidoreductase
MRAFAVRGFGEAPAIHDLPLPTADGAPVIRVTYAGVNPIDYKLVDQLTPQSTCPFVMGIDFAGVTERGDRVFGMECRR